MIDNNRTLTEKIINTIRPGWTYTTFWNDIRFTFLTQPRYKKLLMKGMIFAAWDIVDSIAEITFKQFEIYWREYGCKRYENKEYLEMSRKEQKIWYNAIIIQERIFRHITDTRKHNKNSLDEILSEQSKYERFSIIPCEMEKSMEKFFETKTEYLDGYFDISYSFNKENRITIKKIKPVNINKNHYHNIKNKMDEIDDKYLKLIIDYRPYMWD